MKKSVFVVAFAVALLFCLVGAVFFTVAKYGKVGENYKRICIVFSWVFFYIAIGVAIGDAIVYFMLNYNGPLN